MKCTYVHTHRNSKNTKHRRFSWFRYETFITFLTLRFSTRGERETHNFYYADCSIWPDNARAHSAVHKLHWPRPGPKNQLASSKSKSQLAAFSKSLRIPAYRFRAWRHSHSQSISYLGFLCDICDCHILPARAWTPALMSAPTHALSRKVLSLTKPKDKMYKTKNDNIKKSFRNYITHGHMAQWIRRLVEKYFWGKSTGG